MTTAVDTTMIGWGANDGGQLGTGSKGLPIATPVAGAQMGHEIVDADAGYHVTTALTRAGKVLTVGEGLEGERGVASFNNTEPTEVALEELVDKIAAGGSHSIVRFVDGRVATWGNNHAGQTGNGEVGEHAGGEGQRTPVVLDLEDVTKVTAGGNTCLVLKGDGTAFAWGGNETGQRGDGTEQKSAWPVQVVGVPPLKDIALGGANGHGATALGLDVDGIVWAWGNGKQGQFPGYEPANYPTPVALDFGERIVEISCSFGQTLARGESGTVYRYGAEPEVFGEGPVALPGVPTKIVAGLGTAAYIIDGLIYTQGDQAGRAEGNALVPEPLEGITGAVNVSLGETHCVAVITGSAPAMGIALEATVKGCTGTFEAPQGTEKWTVRERERRPGFQKLPWTKTATLKPAERHFKIGPPTNVLTSGIPYEVEVTNHEAHKIIGYVTPL